MDIDAARRKILTHGAVEHRIAASSQIVHDFRCNQQDRLARPAVNRGMRVSVAFEPKRMDKSGGHCTFRQTASRGADLQNGALHSPDYSTRNAVIGSTFMARRAGR